MNKKNTKSLIWLSLIGLLIAAGLTGCKAETPEEKQTRICREMPVPSHLQPTISSDGKMIAVLSYVDNCGKKRLRYKNVDPEGPWQELPIGTGVDSIRFGLKAHELMVTRRVRPNDGTKLGEINKVDSWAELYKVDLDRPDLPPQTLYEAYGVTKPVEVTPGVIMVQNCVTTPDKRCHSLLGWQWDLIKDGKLIHRWPYGGPDGNRGNLNFSWPNVVPGQGAFWFKPTGYVRKDEPYADFWRVAFPGKTAPVFKAPLEVGTVHLNCDYKIDRCLRGHLKGAYAIDETGSPKTNIPGRYTYIVGSMYREKNCLLNELAGYFESMSISPNGNAAVVSFKFHEDKSPHVAVMKFDATHCEPTSIQHIYLEGK